VSNFDATGSLKGRLAGREINLGPRRAITLVAPGNKISLLNPDGKGSASQVEFAAPHVTATVALLQEFGFCSRRTLLLRQLGIRQLNWSFLVVRK